MSENQKPKTRGRPVTFDKKVVLEIAMKVFWERGYEGTSLSDLTEAMGINRPSLYAAFGNKQRLFYAVIEHYMKGPLSYFDEAMSAPTSQSVIEHLMRTAVIHLTDEDKPGGCLIVHSALVGTDENSPVRKTLTQYRNSLENRLLIRFEQAIEDGEFPHGVNIHSLAKYVTSMHQGLCVQACSGVDRTSLENVANLFCQNWPKIVISARYDAEQSQDLNSNQL